MAGSELRYSIDPAVVIEAMTEGVRLRAGPLSLTLPGVAGATLAALERLRGAGGSEDELVTLVEHAEGVDALADLYHCLGLLGRRSLLRVEVRLDGRALLTLVPTSRGLRPGGCPLVPDRRYTLSRFAAMRSDGGQAVLESPIARARAIVHDARVASLLYALAGPRDLSGVADAVPALPVNAISRSMGVLLDAGMLVEATDGEADEALEVWEFHDLLFHERSRSRAGAVGGGTFRFAGLRPPTPPRRPSFPGPRVELTRPDPEEIIRRDPPFSRVQDERRSIREYGATPVDVRQLGEFLYRAGRVTRQARSEVATPAGLVPMDFAWRPFPGGGALYELELYPIVRRCGGLEPGLYHYDPFEHALEFVSAAGSAAGLLEEAGRAAGIAPDRIQVLIVVAARFGRVFWKYSGIGYATILKDVGSLYQTMYLVATAMGLAPCAVGAGNPEEFASASGNPPLVEGSVGEFLLGSRGVADEPRHPGRRVAHSAAPQYDLRSLLSAEDPHPTFRRMREDDPAYWHAPLRAWFLTRYDDVAALARDPRYTATRQRKDGADCPAALRDRVARVENFLGQWLPLNDAPEHARIRRLAALALEADAAESLRALTRSTCARCLDAVASRGGFDAMSGLAFPVASAVLAHLLGVPEADIPRLKAWVKDVTTFVNARRPTDPALTTVLRGVDELTAYFRQLRSTPRRPVPGTVWAASRDGAAGAEGLDDEGVAALATVFVMGGYETVAYQIGNTLLALLSHPDELRKVRERPERLAGAVEESLRYEPSALLITRRTREAVVLHGMPIPANAVVIGVIPAANRDPLRFPEPDQFDVDRRPNRHLGLGHGAHSCLGAALARLQSHVVVGELLQRFPGLALDGTPAEKVTSVTFQGRKGLACRFNGPD